MKFLDRNKGQENIVIDKCSEQEKSGSLGSYKEFLYGCAFGDAWGFETEFKKWQEIKGTRPGLPETLIITDDTQMSIYTLRATLDFFRNLSKKDFQGSLKDTFETFSREVGTELSEKGIDYLNEYRRTLARYYLVYREDPDNNRAPGATVMGSLAEYRKYLEELKGNSKALEGLKGYEGATDYSTAVGSVLTLGCGSIMRTPVLGVFSDLLSDEALFMLGVIASEPTHRHPLGALVSGLASLVTGKLLKEGQVPSITGELLDYYSEFYNDYIELSRELGSPEWVLLKKENDCDYYANFLEKLSQESIEIFQDSEDSEDICSYAGPGWRADEAFICAYYSLLRYSEEPLEGVRRLVHSSGDSDSIAAIGTTWLGALIDYRARHRREDKSSADTFTYSSYEGFLEGRYRKEISDLVHEIDLFIGEAFV